MAGITQARTQVLADRVGIGGPKIGEDFGCGPRCEPVRLVEIGLWVSPPLFDNLGNLGRLEKVPTPLAAPQTRGGLGNSVTDCESSTCVEFSQFWEEVATSAIVRMEGGWANAPLKPHPCQDLGKRPLQRTWPFRGH